MTGSTQANVNGGSLTSSNGNINITSSMTHQVTTTADGTTTTGEGDTGVGIAVGIGAVDVSNKATISGNVNLSAKAVNLNAVTNPSQFKVEAKSGASGEGDGADTTVAGALAVNVAVIRTESILASGANVNANNSNLNLQAQSTTVTTANAIPVENSSGTSLGIGASVAVLVNDLTTRSVIQNNATITNANDLTLSAISDNGMNTLAKAGAAGGTAIAASVGLAIAHHDTIARIESGGTPVSTSGNVSLVAIGNGVTVISNGPLSITSSANTDAAAIADGSAVGGEDAAVGAAVAINLANVTNVAMIENGTSVTADGITLSAKMQSVAGDAKHTLGAHSTSGAGSSGVGVAGSFALNISNVLTEADVKGGATLTLADGNDPGNSVGLTKIESYSTTVSTVTADAAQTDNGDLGIGASVAINITNHDTRAELENSAVISGAHNLTLQAKSDHAVITQAKAGSGGDVGLTPVVALGFAYHTTEARIGTQNGTLAVTGSLSETAEHTGLVDSKATGATSGNDLAVGASLGLSYVKENISATTARSLSTGGEMTLTAKSASIHTTDATASASGAQGDTSDKNGNGGTGQSVQGQVDDQRAVGNSQSSNNTTGNKSSGTENKATATTADSKNDQDSDGDGISVAAAIAVSIVESNVNAEIGNGLTISSGGLLTVRSTQNADAKAIASGKAVTEGDVGIAAAVAINVADVRNEARIGASAITADGLIVEALMTDVAGEATDTHSFSAESESGAGGKDVGVAGSLAVNHAAVKTSAIVSGGAKITLEDGGDFGTGIGPVSIKASSVTSNTAQATPVPGTNGGTGGVGVGASVAIDLNYHDTTAAIEDGVSWYGGLASSIAVEATANHTVATTAKNGASAEDVGIGGSVAVVISKNNTTAYVGTGPGAIQSSGAATVKADHTSSSTSTVSAAASGDDAAIGASVGVHLVTENVRAELARDLNAGGNVAVTSQMKATSTLTVTASAGGGDSGGDSADQESSKQANQDNAKTKDQKANGESNKVASAGDSADSANSQSDSESSSPGGSVGIAAAVAMNVLSLKNEALISHGADVSAGTLSNGTLTVGAQQHVVASSQADSTAVDLEGDASIGAAVAFNWVSMTNSAKVSEGSSLSGNGIVIEAVTPGNLTNDFTATAFSAAGNKGDAGIAGVVAINVVDADTTAMTGDNSHLTSTGSVAVTAENQMRVQAAAASAGFSTETAVGAAVAINMIGLSEQGESGGSRTTASIGDPNTAGTGVSVTASGAVTVSATHTVGMFQTLNLPDSINNAGSEFADPTIQLASMAVAGGGSSGSVGLAGSVSINLFETSTHAGIDRNATVAAGSLTVKSTDTTNLNSIAGALGIGADGAGVGAGLDLQILHKDTRASIGRSASVMTVDAVAVIANSSEDLLSVSANIGVGNSAGIAGSASVQVIETSTRAMIESGTNVSNGATITAGNNVGVTATGVFTSKMIAGAVGVASSAGIGAANTTLVHEDNVEASVGDWASITADGTGLSVIATSSEDLITLAAAGGAAGTAAIAAVVNVLNEHTLAFIGENVTIDADNGAAVGTPHVAVASSDQTEIVSVAGSLAAGGVAVGVGADVASINKSTTASIGSNAHINAEGNIIVAAKSSEDITSVAAGLSAGGNVAVGVDASVHVLNLKTRAFIGDDYSDQKPFAGAGDVYAKGNVVITADDSTEIDKVVGVLAAGTVGIAAGGAVTVIDKTTETFIGSGACVTGDGTTGSVTVNSGKFTTSSDPNGAKFTPKDGSAGNKNTGVGIEVTATTGDGNLSAQGEINVPNLPSMDADQKPGNDLTDDTLTGNRTLQRATQSGFRGVALGATNSDDIESITIGMAGGTVGVAVAAGVNVVKANTKSFVGDDAVVNDNMSGANNSQSVLVAAGDDFYHMNIGLTLAAGTAAISPAVGVTVVTNTTEAFIGSSAKVNAKNDVIVSANASEDILLVGLALAGGTVGVSGAVNVLTIDNHVTAAIGDGASVFAGGDLGVLAVDATDIDQISGAVAGGFVGVGASVGVLLVNKVTQASIGDGAHVDALGGGGTGIAGVLNGTNSGGGDFGKLTSHGVVVQAQSSEEIFHLSIAGGGGFVGVGGAVGVTLIDSDTLAIVGHAAQINQTNGNSAGLSGQNVYINASNDLKVTALTGALAGGFVGVSGAVNIGSINNDTLAEVQTDAQIRAVSDVEVNAVSHKSLEGYTVSGAGGFAGLTAAVSVWSIGQSIESSFDDEDAGKPKQNALQGDTDNNGENGIDGEKADQSTANLTVERRQNLTGSLGKFSSGNQNDNKQSNTERLHGIVTGSSTRLNADAPSASKITGSINGKQTPSGTTATVATDTMIVSGNNISVTAHEDVAVNLVTGGFGGGVLGAGASVGIFHIAANTSAGSLGTLSAAGKVTVEAILDESVTGLSLSGGVGLVGLGAAVTEVTDTSVVQAAIGHVIKASSVTVLADANQTLSIETGALQAGGVAAGASFNRLTVDGEVTASVLGGAQIGQVPGQTVGSLSVTADSTIVAQSKTVAIAAGGLAISANFAFTDVTPNVMALVGPTANLKTTGSTSIRAIAEHGAIADVLTASAAVGATGASIAKATLGGVVSTTVAGTAQLQAGSISLESRLNHNGIVPSQRKARAKAEAASVAIGSVNGTFADAIASTDVSTTVGEDAVLSTSTGGVSIRSFGSHQADADAIALSLTIPGVPNLVALGGSFANATANGATKTELYGDVHNNSSGTLIVRAEGINHANAFAEAGSDALIGFTGAQATANASPIVSSITGLDSFVDIGGGMTVEAIANNDANANADGTVPMGLVGIGIVDASAKTSGVAKATHSGTVYGGALTIKATAENTAHATSEAASGGLLAAGNAVEATVDFQPKVNVHVSGRVDVTGPASMLANSVGDAQAIANTTGFGAGVTVGGSVATVTAKPDVSSIAQYAGIHSDGALTIVAQDTLKVKSDAGSAAVGTVAAGRGTANNIVAANVSAAIRNGNHMAQSMTMTASETLTADASAKGKSFGGLSVAGGQAANDVGNNVLAELYEDVFLKTPGNVTLSAIDQSTVNSNVDQTAGGLTGTGTASTINNVHNTVEASLDKLVQLTAGGNVQVKATEATKLQATSVNASAGLFAVAGNIGINTVANDVAAFIARNSAVHADNNLLVQADVDNAVSVKAGNVAGGIGGAGGTVIVNTFDNKSRAFIDEQSKVSGYGIGNPLTIRNWDESTGIETTENLNGLAVIAHTHEHPLAVSDGLPDRTVRAVNAAGGLAGLSGVATVNVVNDLTEAFISSSDINSSVNFGDDVIVRAHSDVVLKTTAGGNAVGGLGANGTVDRTIITSQTRAFLSDNDETGKDLTFAPSHVFGRGVEVTALSRETIDTELKGKSGALFAIAGTVSVAEIAASTQAFVRDSDVASQGFLKLRADDTSIINPTVESISAGGFAGGAAVSINTIKTTVQAQVIGSQLDATGALSIVADSDELITPVAKTTGVGAFSLAGTVSVNTIETTTEALVISGDSYSRINQTLAPPLLAVQSVTISANDTAEITSELGNVAAGLAGVGASVDVGAIRNRTVAMVGQRSLIDAKNDVSISAVSDRTLDSTVYAGSLGLLGLSGAVSVLSLGAPAAGDALSEFNKTQQDNPNTPANESDPGNSLLGQTNATAKTGDVSSAVGNNSLAQQASNRVNSLADPTINGTLNPNLDVSGKVTAAFIENAASSNQKAVIHAGGSVSIAATNTYDVDQSVGSTSGGFLGFGVGVGVATVNNTTRAFVGDRGIVQAAGDVTIQAKDQARNTLSVDVTGGAAGLIAFTANVAVLNVTSTTSARIGQYAQITDGDSVTVAALQSASLDVDGRGYSAGLAAGGVVLVKADVKANVDAAINDGAAIGNDIASVGSVIVKAEATNAVHTDAEVAQIGLLALNDGEATSNITARVVAALGDVDVDASGGVGITAESTSIGTADVRALAGGGAAGGYGKSVVAIDGDVTSSVANGADLDVGNLYVTADRTATATADAEAIAAGLLAGNAAESHGKINGTIEATIGNANVRSFVDTEVSATATQHASATTGQAAVGLIAGGGSVADASISGDIRAAVAAGADIKAGGLLPGDVLVLATSNNSATSDARATGKGLFGGSAANATSNVDVNTRASIGQGKTCAKGNIYVQAVSTNQADADADGEAFGVAAVGGVVANATVAGVTRSAVNGTITAEKGSLVVQALDTDSFARANAKSAGGGVVALNGAEAHASLYSGSDKPHLRANVLDNASITAGGNVEVRAKLTNAESSATSTGVSVGLITVGGTTTKGGGSFSTADLSPTIHAVVGTGVTLAAGGNITIEAAQAEGLADAKSYASSAAGLFGFIGAKADATANGVVKTSVGNSTLNSGLDVNVLANASNEAQALGKNSSVGLIGIGDISATANAGEQTSVSIADNAHLQGRDLKIRSLSSDYATTNVFGSGKAFVAAQAAKATTIVQSDVSTLIGNTVSLAATRDIVVTSESRAEGDAISKVDTDGFGAVGLANASVVVNPTVETTLAEGSKLSGRDITVSATSGVTKPNSAGDGYSAANATGSPAESFIGIQGGNATVALTPETRVTIGKTVSGPTIDAQRDVLISTSSTAKADAFATNGVAGVAGGSSVLSGVIIDNISEVLIAAGAKIVAGDDLTITAAAFHSGDATADANSAGGINIVEADAYVDIDYTTRIDAGNNAELKAADQLKLTADTSSSGYVNADSLAEGGVGKASANDSADEGDENDQDDLQLYQAQRGLRIGAKRANTKVEIGKNAVIQGETVELLANIGKSGGESIGTAISKSGGSDLDALARVELDDDADILVKAGATILGAKHVYLTSQIGEIKSRTTATADEQGNELAAGADAHSLNDVQSDARVKAEDGAYIQTHELKVKARINGRDFFSDATKSAAVGSENYHGDFDPAREIIWDADIELTSGRTVLIIDSAGNEIERDGIDYTSTAANIVVAPVINDHPGSVLFETNTLAPVTIGNPANDSNLQTDYAPSGQVHSLATEAGATPFKITFRQTLDEVHIENHSGKGLVLSDILVVNTTRTPQVTINSEFVNPNVNGMQYDFFGFDIAQKFEPTLIQIQQLNFSSYDVVVGGLIDNPIGTTDIINQGGKVLTIGGGTIRTNQLIIDADDSIGTQAFPLKVEYVASEQRPTGGKIHADGNVWLNIRGLNRDKPSANYQFSTGEISGDNVDIFLNPAIQQTTPGPAPSMEVDIFEKVPNTHSIRKFHYRPEAAGILNTPLGVFGLGNTEVESTWFFSGITSSGNIRITTADTPIDINIQAVTDIIGNGKIDVSGNGDITIIEKNGDLQIGLILTTSGNVFLGSVNGSIIDQDNDAAPDVVGSSITFAAFQGSVGSKDNPIEINSSVPVAGLVSATAKGGIYLTEVVGDFNVGKITSLTGDVCLTAIRGSIVDGNNDSAVDIQGVNITLIAPNGSIGEPTDDLDLDSSNPTPGTVTAIALGGDSNIWISELGTISIELIQSSGTVSVTTTGDLEIKDLGIILAEKPIKLKIGGGLYTAYDSRIQSNSIVTIYGDWQNGNRQGGTTMILAGRIIGSSIDIFGGDDADQFFFSGMFGGGPVTVKSGKGNDLFHITSLQGLPGVEITGREALTLDGEDGSDSYFIQLGRLSRPIKIADSGRKGKDRATIQGTDADEAWFVRNNAANGAASQTGGFVATNLIGQRVDYSQTLEYLMVSGRGGNDTFYVQPSQTTRLTIDGGFTETRSGSAELNILHFDSFDLPVKRSGSTLRTQGGRPEKYLPVNIQNIDITPPEAVVSPLPAVSTSRTIVLEISHSDPRGYSGEPVSGVAYYDVYVAVDSGPWTLFARRIPATQPRVEFTAESNHQYQFRAVATDAAGNREEEPDRPHAEARTRTEDLDAPETQVTAVSSNQRLATLNVRFSGVDPGGSGIREIRVYVSIDGRAPQLIGTPIVEKKANPGKFYDSALDYQGIRDGVEHTYRFFTVGIDFQGNVEDFPSATGDIVVRETFFPEVIRATGIDVQNGETQRSYINEVDILFSDSNKLQTLIDNDRIRMERFGIDSRNPVIGTGSKVTGFRARQDGNSISLKFGDAGLGGADAKGDGFYRISLDLDGDGRYDDQHFEFFRLFGDADGNGRVDASDQDSIREDLNGDGKINSRDRQDAKGQIGRKIDDSLFAWLDD